MKKNDIPVFIHSDLDDYGLDPFEFRIYARIARRAGQGIAFESISRMAEGTQMSERKARYAVALLLKLRLIEKEHRSGRSSIIKLTSKDQWAPKRQLIETRREVMGNQASKREQQKSQTTSHSNLAKQVGKECKIPLQEVPDTHASGAGPIEDHLYKGSTDKNLTSINIRLGEGSIFDEELIRKLQADLAYRDIDVQHVRNKMVAHCKRTGKSMSLDRLEKWLHREWRHQNSKSTNQKGAENNESSEQKRETASERNARLRIESFDLLSQP